MPFGNTHAEALYEMAIHYFGLAAPALQQELQNNPNSLFKKLVSYAAAYGRVLDEKMSLERAVEEQTNRVQELPQKIADLTDQLKTSPSPSPQQQSDLLKLREQLQEEQKTLDQVRKKLQEFTEKQRVIINAFTSKWDDLMEQQGGELLDAADSWLKNPLNNDPAAKKEVEDVKEILQLFREKHQTQASLSSPAAPPIPAAPPLPLYVEQIAANPNPVTAKQHELRGSMLQEVIMVSSVFRLRRLGAISNKEAEELMQARGGAVANHVEQLVTLEKAFGQEKPVMNAALASNDNNLDKIENRVGQIQADFQNQQQALVARSAVEAPRIDTNPPGGPKIDFGPSK